MRKYFILSLIAAGMMSFYCKNAVVKEIADPNFNKTIRGERIKSIWAGILWKRADKLMHKGASDPSKQKFKAGSYVGNTDIIPLFRVIKALRPQELMTYKMLSGSLAYAGKLKEAEKVLDEGIKSNPNEPGIHELYASLALLRLFYKTEKPTKSDIDFSIKNIKKAIDIYKEIPEFETSDPGFTMKNYVEFLARLYVEQDKFHEAVTLLSDYNIDLYDSDDMLLKCLRKYKDSGIKDKQMFIDPSAESDTSTTESAPQTDHNCCEHDHCQEAPQEHIPYIPAIKLCLLLSFAAVPKLKSSFKSSK